MPVIVLFFLAMLFGVGFLGFMVSRYLAMYQLGYSQTVWDPFFGFDPGGSGAVLDSEMSHMWPVSDAGLGGELVEPVEQLGDRGPLVGGSAEPVHDELDQSRRVAERVERRRGLDQLREAVDARRLVAAAGVRDPLGDRVVEGGCEAPGIGLRTDRRPQLRIGLLG